MRVFVNGLPTDGDNVLFSSCNVLGQAICSEWDDAIQMTTNTRLYGAATEIGGIVTMVMARGNQWVMLTNRGRVQEIYIEAQARDYYIEFLW